MENVTLCPVNTNLAKTAIERARKALQQGFMSTSHRDAYADYLKIPYGDLRRALALHCEHEKLASHAMCDKLLPVMLGQVRQAQLQAIVELSDDFTELAAMVRELLALRQSIKGAVIA